LAQQGGGPFRHRSARINIRDRPVSFAHPRLPFAQTATGGGGLWQPDPVDCNENEHHDSEEEAVVLEVHTYLRFARAARTNNRKIAPLNVSAVHRLSTIIKPGLAATTSSGTSHKSRVSLAGVRADKAATKLQPNVMWRSTMYVTNRLVRLKKEQHIGHDDRATLKHHSSYSGLTRDRKSRQRMNPQTPRIIFVT